MKRRTFVMALLALGLVCLPGTMPRSVGAQEAVTLRIATLAPRGSAWMRVFDAWNNSLRQQTGNRLQLRFYPGGAQGDDADRGLAGRDDVARRRHGVGDSLDRHLAGPVRAHQDVDAWEGGDRGHSPIPTLAMKGTGSVGWPPV